MTRIKAPINTRQIPGGYLEFTGNAHERGYQYGEKIAKNIEEMLNRNLAAINQSTGISREQILRTASKFYPYIEEYSQEIAQELQGQAEGSGRKLDEILLLTSFNEILYYYTTSRTHTYGALKGCTSFCANGEATVDRETYIGQNVDGGIQPNFD